MGALRVWLAITGGARRVGRIPRTLQLPGWTPQLSGHGPGALVRLGPGARHAPAPRPGPRRGDNRDRAPQRPGPRATTTGRQAPWGFARTCIRSPCGPNRLMISTGASPVLPNQCGSRVSNSATSPAVSTVSCSASTSRSFPLST